MSLALHANVFAAATKYAVSGLSTLAALYFKQKLQELCSSKTPGAELGEAIRIVFNRTPDNVSDLREPVREALLRPGSRLLELSEVGTAVDSIDGLALDLLRQCRREVLGPRNVSPTRVIGRPPQKWPLPQLARSVSSDSESSLSFPLSDSD